MILRGDVGVLEAGRPLGIPQGNPFAAAGNPASVDLECLLVDLGCQSVVQGSPFVGSPWTDPGSPSVDLRVDLKPGKGTVAEAEPRVPRIAVALQVAGAAALPAGASGPLLPGLPGLPGHRKLGRTGQREAATNPTKSYNFRRSLFSKDLPSIRKPARPTEQLGHRPRPQEAHLSYW